MEIETWGILAPIPVNVDWAGVRHSVRFHLLNLEEEKAIRTAVKAVPEEHQLLEEGLQRIARSIVTIDDISFDETFPTLDSKLQYLSTRDSSLADLLGSGYTVALFEPTKAIEAVENEGPNSESGHANSGLSSVTGDFTTTDR